MAPATVIKTEHSQPIAIPTSPLTPHKPALTLTRNINCVLLGKIRFQTWFFSPYPPDLLNPPPPGTPTSATTTTTYHPTSAIAKTEPPITTVLHVCRHCFRYTPSSKDYLTHLALCTLKDGPPGQKVYDWDGYSVWEVDGETETLFCQNLSLFAKLFLDHKSVFFDVGGFTYYILTYTPRPTKRHSKSTTKATPIPPNLDHEPNPHILGFFSKEKLSWDSNNLACILIFPPHQHLSLGRLLMSVSYKLSGWEWEGGVIGGPEKPLSEMGRRSYSRFWEERIARFFLGGSRDADGYRAFENRSGKGGKKRKKEEMTVKELGERTGMLTEDVAAAVRGMGVCEPVIKKQKKKKLTEDGAVEKEEDAGIMIVRRERVREWARGNGVDGVDPVREEGFIGEWAASDADSDEDEDEDEEVEEIEDSQDD